VVKQLRFNILHLSHPYAIVWRLNLGSDGGIPLHWGGGTALCLVAELIVFSTPWPLQATCSYFFPFSSL
jgi:hypothetical protein